MKVNPVKKALNSLFGKDKEELDVSDELVGEAVTNDGEYTGPAHNSVVSSDGKVQIRNFEVFWTSTDEDIIVDTKDYKLGYSNRNYNLIFSKFNHEPKMQINWALSGEVQYPKGAMTITIPDMQFENENDLKYSLSGYSIPEAKLKEDGSIDFDASYGNATLAYYYNEDEKAYKITNIIDLAPGASGTFTLTYGDYAGNSRWLRDMSIHESKPVIDLKYKYEVLKTQDKALKIQQDTKIEAQVYKNGNLFKTWQEDWGTELKPENSEDYWYVCYEIVACFYDYLQTNLDYKITDTLVDTYSSVDSKKIKVEQEIIAYSNLSKENYSLYLSHNDKVQGIKAPRFVNIPQEKNKIELQNNINVEDNETKKDVYANKNVYKTYDGDPYYFLADRYRYVYVLTKIPAKKLGYIDDKKSHYVEVENNAQLEVTPKNSNDNSFIRTASKSITDTYTYTPKAEFTAPTGKTFLLDKKCYGQNKNFNYPQFRLHSWKRLYPSKNIYKDMSVIWTVMGTSYVADLTKDESFKDENNPMAIYGRKKIRYELADDYLYLANDYFKELTSEDYSVDYITLRVEPQDYGYVSNGNYYGYEYANKFNLHPIIYARKKSTGKWEQIAEFDLKNSNYPKSIRCVEGSEVKNVTMYDFRDKNNNYGGKQPAIQVKIPEGYSSVKAVYESEKVSVYAEMQIFGALKTSERVKKTVNASAHDDLAIDITLRNDSTLAAYNEKGDRIALKGTTKSSTSVDRTLELDRKNYGEEMYHDSAYITLLRERMPEIKRYQKLDKLMGRHYEEGRPAINDPKNKQFIIPTKVRYREDLYNTKTNEVNPLTHIHEQNSGIFYDLLPRGVTGVKNVNINGYSNYNKDSYYIRSYTDKNTGLSSLNTTYKLIPNWKDSGRIMLVAKFNNAKLNGFITDKYGGDSGIAGISLYYEMIYPWDSYKDYGSKIERNLVAYESGFKKRPNDGLDDSLTSDLEDGYKDDPTDKMYGSEKVFTDQEIEWMKDLNPNHDEKRFLYALDSTTVSGDTEANVGLTKHVSTNINPNFTLKSTTKEGGNYQYKIRLQAAHGTSVSNLVFFDSIENYDPLKADEDYGVKQWRGTLSSIDLTHPIMKGIDPKVYVSTIPKLNIEKHNDVTDSSVWKLHKDGDDLSNVQAVAIDLRKNKDGSDFKLAQDTAINVYLNMKAPWNLKEKQIDPKAKALNAIYASNTVTTSLDNKSTKLIYTAYTAVDLKHVTTETQIKATKKHLDKECKDIALKGEEFTFELKDSEGKTIQTKTNDNKGNVTFDPIKYNSWDVGEHTYTIEEVEGNDNKIDYDKHIETVKVNVERVGDSELKATTIYDSDGANFINKEKRTAALQIIKLIDDINEVALDSIKDSNENILSYKVSEKDKDKVLSGAEYELYKVSDDKQTTVVTKLKTVNGVSKVISNLEPGKYFLKETKAPEGYEINPHKIEINIEENDLGTIKVVFVNDKAKPGMPSTGVFPIKLITIGGNIALLSLGIYLVKKRKTSNI